MSPQEIQRMMDFILRSQADAIIRMEQSEEKQDRRLKQQERQQERRYKQIDERLDRAIAAVEEAAKLSRDAMRESRAARAATRVHEKRIRTVARSSGFLKRRSDDMKQLMKLAMRLIALQSKRLDELASRS